MPLINLRTNLKSIKYGRDRQGDGSSNQPYITSPIPDGYSSKSPDFLLRNGFLAPVSAGKDLIRLSSMFLDTKSINGFLFIVKQNLLSRTSVKPFGSANVIGEGSPLINQGFYTPLQTLGQASLGFLGYHQSHLIIPYTYSEVIKSNTNAALNSPDGILRNRLVALSENKVRNKSIGGFGINNNIPTGKEDIGKILSYSGGPESTLGFGDTIIKFSDQRTGVNNINGKKIIEGTFLTQRNITSTRTRENWITPITKGASAEYIDYMGLPVSNNNLLRPGGGGNFILNENSSFTFERNWDNSTTRYGLFQTPLGIQARPSLSPRLDIKTYQVGNKQTITSTSPQSPIGVKGKGKANYPTVLGGTNVYNSLIPGNGPTLDTTENISLNVYSDFPNNNSSISGENNTNYTSQKDLIQRVPLSKNGEITNFENNSNFTKRNYLNNTLDYNFGGQKGSALNKEIEYDLGDPGSKSKKTLIEQDPFGYRYSIDKSYALDKINASSDNISSPEDDDVINFKIKIIGGTTLTFRAFLESFNDSYNAEWDGFKYVGRGENFYNYKGFDRNIGLTFNVYAQSKGELRGMYKKLNILASSLSPKYTSVGFMKGNLIKLTVGKYIVDQPGILKQLNYEINLDASWDIDKDIQIPHMIKVTSFQFIPLHEFLPSYDKPYLASNLTNNYTLNPRSLPSTYTNKYSPPPLPPNIKGIPQVAPRPISPFNIPNTVSSPTLGPPRDPIEGLEPLPSLPFKSLQSWFGYS